MNGELSALAASEHRKDLLRAAMHHRLVRSLRNPGSETSTVHPHLLALFLRGARRSSTTLPPCGRPAAGC